MKDRVVTSTDSRFRTSRNDAVRNLASSEAMAQAGEVLGCLIQLAAAPDAFSKKTAARISAQGPPLETHSWWNYFIAGHEHNSALREWMSKSNLIACKIRPLVVRGADPAIQFWAEIRRNKNVIAILDFVFLSSGQNQCAFSRAAA